MIYDFITPYSISETIKNNNIASGVALGGTYIALSIIVRKGIAGDFINYQESIFNTLLFNVIAFMFLPVSRFIMDKAIFPGSSLSKEIIKDKNVGMGCLEASVAIMFAMIIRVIF